MWHLQMICSKFAIEVNPFFRPVILAGHKIALFYRVQRTFEDPRRSMKSKNMLLKHFWEIFETFEVEWKETERDDHWMRCQVIALIGRFYHIFQGYWNQSLPFHVSTLSKTIWNKAPAKKRWCLSKMSFVRKWVSNYWQVIHASWWTPLELFESNLLEGGGSIGGRIRCLHITFIHARRFRAKFNL